MRSEPADAFAVEPQVDTTEQLPCLGSKQRDCGWIRTSTGDHPLLPGERMTRAQQTLPEALASRSGGQGRVALEGLSRHYA